VATTLDGVPPGRSPGTSNTSLLEAYGNGIPLARTVDRDYRLTAQTAGTVQALAFRLDPNGNVPVSRRGTARHLHLQRPRRAGAEGRGRGPVVTVRTLGFGVHSSVHIDNGGDGQPALYDPAGSYTPNSGEPRGTGDILYRPDADLNDYRRYHENAGDTVETTRLPTTPQEEADIIRNAEEIGGAGAFRCTIAASGALGGLCGIPTSFLPGSLADDAAGAECQ
jgi:hypothetical protein